ncbi:similar to An02g12970 [Aspergillus luchuensis]|uniref:Similar to An02g12970 n=1 Tax=Aspergillus kawachii TaxID=1069201 RepID=A0A146EY69_ASPKA|nr:similar to An02g12970 [Aspergillus luchuensis]
MTGCPKLGRGSTSSNPCAQRSPATIEPWILLAAKKNRRWSQWRRILEIPETTTTRKEKPTTQVMVGSGGNGKTRTPMHGAAEGREKRGKGD